MYCQHHTNDIHGAELGCKEPGAKPMRIQVESVDGKAAFTTWYFCPKHYDFYASVSRRPCLEVVPDELEY